MDSPVSPGGGRSIGDGEGGEVKKQKNRSGFRRTFNFGGGRGGGRRQTVNMGRRKTGRRRKGNGEGKGSTAKIEPILDAVKE